MLYSFVCKQEGKYFCTLEPSIKSQSKKTHHVCCKEMKPENCRVKWHENCGVVRLPSDPSTLDRISFACGVTSAGFSSPDSPSVNSSFEMNTKPYCCGRKDETQSERHAQHQPFTKEVRLGTVEGPMLNRSVSKRKVRRGCNGMAHSAAKTFSTSFQFPVKPKMEAKLS